MEKPILHFYIGDETKPKIENIDKKDIQTTFFCEVYQKAFYLINDILPSFPDISSFEDESQIKNNIIAFVGDRGSGKTSCMKTVHKMLLSKDQDPYKSACETLLPNVTQHLEKFQFASLPIIDPSYFEDKTNLVEIVVTHMFSKFKEHTRKSNEELNSSLGEFQGKKQDLIAQFQRVKTCLDTIHGQIDKPNDSIDSLAGLAHGIDLKKALNKLIVSYLKYFKCNILIIAIDDIDLHTSHAYQMVEQMRKYLIQPNVIILAGVKISQLNDLIKQHYYQAHKDLINQNGLSDTIEDMSGRYLSKLFPLNQRIMMPDLNQRWSCDILIEKDGDQPRKGPIMQMCVRLIFEKIRYMFYCEEKNPPLIIPRNLRDLLNFISFLYQMPETKEDDLDYTAQLEQNRRLFKNYFINTWCREHLSTKMFTFIKDLETTDITEINKSVIDFLTQIPENKDIILEKAIVYKSNKGYNVSLGDAMYVLDKTSNNQTIPYIRYFTAAIKTFYTFLLSDLIDEEITDKFYDRINDVQLSVFTSTSEEIPIQLKKLNKLNNLSDYEKLLGGNVIRVAQLLTSTSQDASPNKDPKIKRPFIHLHLINIDNHIESIFDNILNKRFSLVTKFDLNIFEFLILTSYLNTDNTHFRSRKHCPYNATLDNEIIDISNPIVYSSTAILFNLVKIYDLYRIFWYEKQQNSALGEEVQDDKITWRDFFTYIKEKKEASLIYQILHFERGGKKDAGRFSNPHVENLFIRNMDTYDALLDYLPFLKSQYKNAPQDGINNQKDRQQWRIFLRFYRKLTNFQYYEYDSDIIFYNRRTFQVLEPVTKFLETMPPRNQDTFRSIFLVNNKEEIWLNLR